MRGLHLRRRTPHPARISLRSFAPPSPTRGEGRNHAAAVVAAPSSTLDQSAALGDAAQMKVAVAIGVFNHGQALEVVADLGLLRHADAAVELDRLPADEF